LLAENGQQAVEIFRVNRPDIVFMDIRMPSGEEGLVTAQQIWQEFGRDAVPFGWSDEPSTKVVAITASVFRHQQQQFLDAGFDRFIAKPFKREELCECLATLLDVEYQYESVSSTEVSDEPELKLAEITLPEPLLSQLLQAAKGGQVTRLKQLLSEVEPLSPDAHRLATHLRERIDSYDVDGVVRILGEIAQK
jgi:CheY-like chemotaxis protein